jgi:hypothetical protein
MEETFYIIIPVLGAAIVGLIVGFHLPRTPKCNHNWKKTEDGELFRYDSRGNRKEKVGFLKVYECIHCNKMRKEQVTL